MKIGILGDSISQGIGSKKINYEKYLIKLNKNNYIINKALTGTTIVYGNKMIDELIKEKIDCIIIFYGNVDALPRPKKDKLLYKLLPNRYKKLGMLDPRALYSSDKKKKIIQKLDSYTRYNIKKILIKLYGYSQFVTIDKFEIIYKELVEKCLNNNINPILVSTVPMCEKYFPKANFEYQKYNNIIKKIANAYNIYYIDIYNDLNKYNPHDIFLYDLYHPNEYGYELIAKDISNKINGMRVKNENKQS